MPFLFALTAFVAAALMFTSEPLVGRLLLPLAGGTPAVWNTCLMFFQAMLLAGYAYAHVLGNLAKSRQCLFHPIVIALGIVALPTTVGAWGGIQTNYPMFELLPVLAWSVGLPFFALATTAPLIQRWFASVLPDRDPYPLYSASNAGSLIALLAYPAIIEPKFTLREQGNAWALGYGLFVALVVMCAAVFWKFGRASVAAKPVIAHNATLQRDPVVRWMLLAMAPSSLLCGVTTYLTTDISPFPLLWVIPLALYLLTFIIAFAGRTAIPHTGVVRIMPVAVLALFFAVLTNSTEPWWVILMIHLLAFFLVALACHGELARSKPPPERLTRFYLWMSLGGVIGGAINALIAPIAFQKLGLAEYPLMLALAVGLMPRRPRPKILEGIPESTGIGALAYPLLVGALAAGLFIASRAYSWNERMVSGALFGLPLVLIYPLVDRPIRMAVGLVVIWLAGLLHTGEGGARLDFERNFYGVVKVTAEPHNGAHRLAHGSTVHGRQFWKDGRGVNEPLSYYGKPGPAGDIFAAINAKSPKAIAGCGLGAGSLAAYAKPSQHWTFYEIDPAVVRIARDPTLFTYLADNFPDPEHLTIKLGDARLEMRNAQDTTFDLIVLDAFSSDAIPVHLLTKEAIEMYLQKLAPGGMIAFHISNRYLNLKPVLASAAKELELTARYRSDYVEDDESRETGRLGSVWVVLVRQTSDLGALGTNSEWEPLPAIPKDFKTWTDDFSNLLSVFNWNWDEE